MYCLHNEEHSVKKQRLMKTWERDIYRNVIDKTDVTDDKAVAKVFKDMPADATLLRYLRDSILKRGWMRDPDDDSKTDKMKYAEFSSGINQSFSKLISKLKSKDELMKEFRGL